jgi:hypothetical protein
MILGLLLALASALAANVAFLLKYRGAVIAAPIRIRHPLASAAALFRSKWFAIGWLGRDPRLGAARQSARARARAVVDRQRLFVRALRAAGIAAVGTLRFGSRRSRKRGRAGGVVRDAPRPQRFRPLRHRAASRSQRSRRQPADSETSVYEVAGRRSASGQRVVEARRGAPLVPGGRCVPDRGCVAHVGHGVAFWRFHGASMSRLQTHPATDAAAPQVAVVGDPVHAVLTRRTTAGGFASHDAARA